MEENNFVDANKVVEKEVNLVESRKEFQESTSTAVCSIVDEQAYETEEVQQVDCEDVIVIQGNVKMMVVFQEEDPNAHSTNDVDTIVELKIINAYINCNFLCRRQHH